MSQGTIPAFLKALQSSLIIRFIDDVELSPLPLDDAEEDVKKVALKIWDAAGLAEENNNNFPAELSHLDAAGVESQVKKEIAKLEAASRKNFESTYKLNLLNPDGTEKTNEQLLAELDAAWNAVENKLGDIDDTNVYDGSTGWTKAWRDLEVRRLKTLDSTLSFGVEFGVPVLATGCLCSCTGENESSSRDL